MGCANAQAWQLPVGLRSQVYSLVRDRTAADQDLEHLRYKRVGLTPTVGASITCTDSLLIIRKRQRVTVSALTVSTVLVEHAHELFYSCNPVASQVVPCLH